MAESDQTMEVGGRVLAPGEGRTVVVPSAGGRVTMKAERSDTGGVVTVFENVLRPYAPGPARHFHRTWTELFYVLDGNLLFEVDGQLRAAPAGTFVAVPPGTVHAFRNPRSEEATLLITFVPGGFEGFFDAGRHLGSPMTDAAAWQHINEQWDIQVVGPPLEGEGAPPASH